IGWIQSFENFHLSHYGELDPLSLVPCPVTRSSNRAIVESNQANNACSASSRFPASSSSAMLLPCSLSGMNWQGMSSSLWSSGTHSHNRHSLQGCFLTCSVTFRQVMESRKMRSSFQGVRTERPYPPSFTISLCSLSCSIISLRSGGAMVSASFQRSGGRKCHHTRRQ